MTERRVSFILGANIQNFQKGLNNAQKKLDRFASRMNRLGQDLALKFTVPIGSAAVAAVKLASDMEESLNKVNVAFQDSAGYVEGFAQSALRSFGMAEGTALDMAALFGDMATSMGLTTMEAANMSTRLVGLAGDLASFKNIQVDVASNALKSVFTGETESLKNLGIVMTQANLQAFALSEGIKTNIRDMTEAEKVQLRYAFVMAKTTNAQGDFARTSRGFANQFKVLQQAIQDVAADFGRFLLPAFTKVITKINQFIERVRELSTKSKQQIVAFGMSLAAIPPLIIGISLAAKGLAMAFAVMSSPVVLAIGAITAGAIAFAVAWEAAVKGVKMGLIIIKKVMYGIKEAIYGMLEGVVAAVERMVIGFTAIPLVGEQFTGLSEKLFSMKMDLKATQAEASLLSKALDYEYVMLMNASATDKLKTALEGLKGMVNDAVFNKIMGLFAANPRMNKSIGRAELPAMEVPQIDLTKSFVDTSKFGKAAGVIKGFGETVKTTSLEIGDALQNTLTGAINSFADTLANVFTGDAGAGGFFKGLMVIIADFMDQLGKAIVAVGFANLALKQSFKNPLAAIAAGTALIVASRVAKNLLERGPQGSVPALATGGLAFGETMALVGDNPNARVDPEVIAPLSKLKGMMGGQNIHVTGNFKTAGRDLVFVTDRTRTRMNR